jgi:hypothetical protein
VRSVAGVDTVAAPIVAADKGVAGADDDPPDGMAGSSNGGG